MKIIIKNGKGKPIKGKKFSWSQKIFDELFPELPCFYTNLTVPKDGLYKGQLVNSIHHTDCYVISKQILSKKI